MPKISKSYETAADLRSSRRKLSEIIVFIQAAAIMVVLSSPLGRPAMPFRKQACLQQSTTKCKHKPCHSRIKRTRLTAHTVEIEYSGGKTTLNVEEGETILDSALDAGLELSHDCKMGVSTLALSKLLA